MRPSLSLSVVRDKGTIKTVFPGHKPIFDLIEVFISVIVWRNLGGKVN